MDRPIEKKSFPRRYIGYIAAAVAVVALLVWIVFGERKLWRKVHA